MKLELKEHDIQCQIIDFLRANKKLCFAVPNGGNRNIVTAIKLKREGVMPGVADIVIELNNKRTVYVEVKTKKGKQSRSQKEFEERIKQKGNEYYIWRSVNDAILFINSLKKTEE